MCPTFYDPMGCSAPGFSVYAISQARKLKWVVISYTRRFFWPKNWVHISWIGKQINQLSVQFSSVANSCLNLCDPMDYSMPGFSVQHQLPEFTQTHVHWVGDAILLSHPLSSPSPPAFSLSQHQGLFKWVSCSQPVAKVLELQFQHQSFQWIYRVGFL